MCLRDLPKCSDNFVVLRKISSIFMSKFKVKMKWPRLKGNKRKKCVLPYWPYSSHLPNHGAFLTPTNSKITVKYGKCNFSHLKRSLLSEAKRIFSAVVYCAISIGKMSKKELYVFIFFTYTEYMTINCEAKKSKANTHQWSMLFLFMFLNLANHLKPCL